MYEIFLIGVYTIPSWLGTIVGDCRLSAAVPQISRIYQLTAVLLLMQLCISLLSFCDDGGECNDSHAEIAFTCGDHHDHESAGHESPASHQHESCHCVCHVAYTPTTTASFLATLSASDQGSAPITTPLLSISFDIEHPPQLG